MTQLQHMPSDAELIAAVRGGDDHAFAQLVKRYGAMLQQEAARVRRNLADDEDLVQEARLALLSAAKAYRSDAGASFATFARVCVRRRLLNAAQLLSTAETPQEDPSLFDEIDKDACAAPSDPDEWLLHKEDEAALLDRLRLLLSDLEYRVLVLRIASYSYDEIASSLKITAKAVDNAVQRIRRKLMRTL